MDVNPSGSQAPPQGQQVEYTAEMRAIYNMIQSATQSISREMESQLNDRLRSVNETLSRLSAAAEAPAGAPATSTETTTQLPPHPPPQTTLDPRRKQLAWPDEFSVGSRYKEWATQMREKLELDKDLLGSDARAWYSINQCLSKGVQSNVSTFYASGGPGGTRQPEQFMKHLDNIYGAILEKEAAQVKLAKCTQSESTPFATFITKFQQLLSDAGGETWGDEARLVWLRGAISEGLKQQLIATDLPTTYYDFVQKVHPIAKRYESTALFKGRRNNSNSGALGGSSAPSPQAPAHSIDPSGDTIMTGVSALGTKKRQPAGRPAAVPRTTSLAAPAPRARWVSDTEVSRRREAGLCFRCGASGHRVAECPYRAAARPRNQTTIHHTIFAAPVLEESSSEEEVSEQGNE